MSRARRFPDDGNEGEQAQSNDTVGKARVDSVDEPEPGRGNGSGAGAGQETRPPNKAGTLSGFMGLDDMQGRQMFACPHCGHELSMFKELRSNRLERIADRSADLVGSWPYLLFLLLAIVTWCLANAFMELFQPHPSAMLGYLGTSLTVLAVLQGPLILLTQRREANRDRARDIESFYIAQNAEADLHSIKLAVNAALEKPSRPGPTEVE